MREKKAEEKKTVMLCGTLLCPITIGRPALFAAGGTPIPHIHCCRPA